MCGCYYRRSDKQRTAQLRPRNFRSLTGRTTITQHPVHSSEQNIWTVQGVEKISVEGFEFSLARGIFVPHDKYLHLWSKITHYHHSRPTLIHLKTLAQDQEIRFVRSDEPYFLFKICGCEYLCSGLLQYQTASRKQSRVVAVNQNRCSHVGIAKITGKMVTVKAIFRYFGLTSALHKEIQRATAAR